MIKAIAPPAAPATADAPWFEELYRSSLADVHAYVGSLLRDPAAAEDITALAFERAYRRRVIFNPARGSARAWLFGIARNAALDELRRRRRSASLLGDVPAEEPAVEDEDERIRHDAVRVGLGRLEPAQRELILLKFHGQLSNAELAKLLGCSVSNAGTRLCRALERLREVCDAAA
ncbi:MAG TPA: sigma-70 family RNA polymerase sigma factor [Solirubrobacteraceae bacterium]|jgi:RNA polymerase sigma factor (sigma-70 family)|nr:sigma-70 family RNA polymerase sigma factor [Solirubrobacteraceae bacterium]